VAVKIRLKRMGAKKRPFYRVVVADARSPRDGRFIESVGYYDPLKNPKVFQVDKERIRHWMATGARPSDAVRELLEREGTLPATAHPVRTKTGPKRAVAPGRGPATPAPVAARVEPAVELAADESPAVAESSEAVEAESSDSGESSDADGGADQVGPAGEADAEAESDQGGAEAGAEAEPSAEEAEPAATDSASEG